MRTVTLKVTEDDLLLGEPKSPTNCPVARAFKAAGFNIAVSVGFARCHLGDGNFIVNNPDSVRSFIEAFDEGRPVLPLKWQIQVPDNL